MIIDAVELKRRYLQRIAGARDNKAYIGPEVVALGVTNLCNLTCRFCWTHGNGNPAHFGKAQYFSWEKFIGIVQDSVELKVDQIQIVGSGEPTIHPLFREMMQYLVQQPLYAKLYTNATFPLDLCSEVIKGDHVMITLGAVDRQQYRDLQGKDLFDRVIANIKHLVSLRDTIKPEFVIEIAYIVNTHNIDQNQKMQELADKLGVNFVYFAKMNVVPYNQEFALPEGSPGDLMGEVKRTPPMCLNGWFHSNINIDDNYSTCYRIAQMRSPDFDKWGFKEYWLSERLMEIRLSGKYGHLQKRYKACETCPCYDKNMQRGQTLSRLRRSPCSLMPQN